MFFDKFGGVHGGFNDTEKTILRTALEGVTQASERAQKAAECGFKDHHGYMKLFFGSSHKKTIKAVADGVNKMHNVLSDYKRLITFVDARNQVTKTENVTWADAPGFAGMHGAVTLASVHRKAFRLSSSTYAYQHPLVTVEHIPTIKWPMSMIKKPKKPYVHIGAGMRLMICEHMFHPSVSAKLRRVTLYHELTHRILQTVDVDKRGNNICNERCIELAREDPKQTFSIADCWAYFVIMPFDEDPSKVSQVP